MEGKGKTGKQFSIVSGHMIFSAGTVKSLAKGILSGIAGSVDRVGAVRCRSGCFRQYEIISTNRNDVCGREQ